MNNSFINIFGSNFNFTIFTHKQYKTIIGTICSIVTIIFSLIFAFLFGEDLLFRQNPLTIISKHKPINYTFYNIDRDNFYFPWRINDFNGNTVHFDKLIFPVFLYEKYERDPLTKVVKYTSEKLKYSPCNPNSSYVDIDIGAYNCFDFDQLSMGGSRDINTFYYLSLFLASCPNGDKYVSNGSCNEDNIIELNDILLSDNYWSFSFIYPEHNFEPNIKDKPLRIIYKHHSIKLNLHLSKIEHFTFQYVNMIDDLGVIAPSEHKYSKFAIFEQSIDYFYTDYLFNENSSTIFYRINFYITKDADEYSRRYIKLPEVLANISGFLKIIMLVFEFICFMVNDSFFYSSLLFTFFSFEEKKKQICLTDISHVIDQDNEPSVNKINIPGVILLNKELHPRHCISPNKKSNAVRSNNRKNNSTIHHSPINNQEKRRDFITQKYIANCILFSCCIKNKEKESEKYQTYSRALKAIKTRLDITEYIRLINESQLMKKELINEEKLKQMKLYEKINPYNSNSIIAVYGNNIIICEEKKQRHSSFLESKIDKK